MNRDEYVKMHAIEDRMWWYRGLHANLLSALLRDGGVAPGLVLDAGCGTGGFLTRLHASFPAIERVGLDFEPIAVSLAAEKSGAPVCVGSVNALPFADGSLGAIVSADVLCHRGVSESAALANFHRCLRPGGALILNLPAYEWMMSAHDRAVDNVRRYGAPSLRQKLRAAGFGRVTTSYWNCLLFPLMALSRKVLATHGGRSDVMTYSAPIEAIFRAVMRIEGFLLARGARLPFGGSIIAVARK